MRGRSRVRGGEEGRGQVTAVRNEGGREGQGGRGARDVTDLDPRERAGDGRHVNIERRPLALEELALGVVAVLVVGEELLHLLEVVGVPET